MAITNKNLSFLMHVPIQGQVLLPISRDASIIKIPMLTSVSNEDYPDLSVPSLGRAVVLPLMIEEYKKRGLPTLPKCGQVVFALRESSAATSASVVTVELLAQNVDTEPVSWSLVAFIMAILNIDLKMLRYRSNAASFKPVNLQLNVYPEPGKINGVDESIIGWCALHGYVYAEDASRTLGRGIFKIFSRSVNDQTLMPYIMFLIPNGRSYKPNSGESIPKEHVDARLTISQTLCPNAPRPLTLFYVLPHIYNFHLDWEECSKHVNIFPASPMYFDISRNDNQMYPRFVPIDVTPDSIPGFHPGPAFYCWKSAPHACHALMMKLEKQHTDYACIRESFHGDAVTSCSADAFRITPISN
jgi:hypothetical protein